MPSKVKKETEKPRKSPPALPANLDPLMTLEQVATALNVSKRVLWAMVAAAEFPTQETYIGTIKRWRVSTVQRWIDDRCSAVAKKG